mmetsp:Transcript_2459/g.9535  ORF Transcript_2459/g.9535 Transcript_2459/m.9535 type:complete len:231 (+) Transcript_2459:680-1372(+)
MTTTGAAAKPRARLPQGGATGATVTTTAAAAATATAGASADRDPAVDTIREAEADRPEIAGAGPRRPSATGAPFVTAPVLPEGAAEAEADRRRRSATGERFATAPDRRPATSATSARRAARGPVNARTRLATAGARRTPAISPRGAIATRATAAIEGRGSTSRSVAKGPAPTTPARAAVRRPSSAAPGPANWRSRRLAATTARRTRRSPAAASGAGSRTRSDRSRRTSRL